MSVQSMKRLQRFLEGAFILTIAGIIIKVLSAAYRVPYQNIVGDIGFYIYQQVYPIYGIALVLSTYGFPVVISKLLAEKYEQGDDAGAQRILAISFVVLLILGIFLFCFLYIGADYISSMMGDEKLATLIKVISFSFLILPVLSMLRGYFQGRNNMLPTAISQVIEQLIRVTTILVFSYILLGKGYGVYEAGAGAIFGSITGGFAAILVLLYFLFKKKELLFKRQNRKDLFTTSKDIIKVLLFQGFTICVSSLLLILIQLVDAFTLYSLLVSNGMDEMLAKKVKGIYDRGQPLIQLGTIVATSISLTLVPLISSAKKRNDYPFIIDKVNLSLRVATIIGIGAAVGLASIITPTNIMLFQDSLGNEVLMVLGISIFFTSIIVTIAAILQGLGFLLFPAGSVIIGMLVKAGLNSVLIPQFSIMGAAVATVVAFALITLLNYFYLQSKLSISILEWKTIGMSILGAIMMVMVIVAHQQLFQAMFKQSVDSRLFATFQSISAVILGAIVYILVIIKGNVFTKTELSFFPMGKKAAYFMRTKKGG